MTNISVIIPTFNDSKDIRKCLGSLKNQTLEWGKDFEVIVVDGHSSDGTDKIAKEMGATVVYENVGTRGGACNVGAKQASSQIIVFTDADAYFPEDWLEKILRKFDETGADVVGGDDILGEDAGKFERLLFLFDVFRGSPKTEKDVVNRLRGVNTAYKKEIFEKVSGFNPELASIEESEMHWRMKKAGAKMVFDSGIFVYHHRRRSLKGLVKQMVRNGIGRINAIRARKELISYMDVLPFVGLLALITSVGLSIVMKSLLPVGAVFGFGALYFLVKPLMVSAKTGHPDKYFQILLLNFVRECCFAYGLFIGIFRKRKFGKM